MDAKMSSFLLTIFYLTFYRATGKPLLLIWQSKSQTFVISEVKFGGICEN
jgi:hypothetical protein